MAEFISVGMLTQPLHHFGSHRHDVWEIIYYTHGTGTALLGEAAIPFQPGTVICMPPRVPQEEHSASGYRNIHILAREVSGLREAIPVFRDEPGWPFLHLASLLHAEMHRHRPDSRLIAQSLFDTLMLYLRRWDQATTRITAVEQLRHQIAERFHQAGFRVESAMDRIPVSKDHLRRLFVRETGATPVEYLHQLRVDHAQQLLAAGFTVKEAASRVGLNDPYYFSRLFRKRTGQSPRTYKTHISPGLT